MMRSTLGLDIALSFLVRFASPLVTDRATRTHRRRGLEHRRPFEFARRPRRVGPIRGSGSGGANSGAAHGRDSGPFAPTGWRSPVWPLQAPARTPAVRTPGRSVACAVTERVGDRLARDRG